MQSTFIRWLLASLTFFAASALPTASESYQQQTSFTIQVNPATTSGVNVTPYAADSLVDETGADTHFSALTPYTDVSGIKSTLSNSNFRHVRDGSPGALPSNVGNGVALGIDLSNPYYHSGNGTFTETLCTVAARISTTGGTCGSQTFTGSPNGDYIELCGNEQDNDPSIGGENGIPAGNDGSNPPDGKSDPQLGINWPTMLKDCIVTETGWINGTYNGAAVNPRNLPIVGPSLVDITDEHFLATALGTSASLLDYTNAHLGLGSFNPEETTIGTTLPEAAADAKLVRPQFFVTECCGYDQQINFVDGAASGGPVYGRGNSIPPAVIGEYDVRSLLTLKALGATRVLFYQFADAPSDCTFGGTGMITATLDSSITPDGYENDNPCKSDSYYSNYYTGAVVQKTNFIEVNNYLGLMSDPGSTFTPTAIPMNLSTSSSYAHTFVAEKRNGHVFVFMWRGEAEYDYSIQYYCPIAATVKPPPNIGSSHTGTCTTTSEWAQATIPNYTEVALHEFQSDGSITNVTSNIPTRVTFTTGEPVVAEFVHN